MMVVLKAEPKGETRAGQKGALRVVPLVVSLVDSSVASMAVWTAALSVASKAGLLADLSAACLVDPWAAL